MAVTYPAAIVIGVVLGLWAAGLRRIECPVGLGNCLPARLLPHSVAALIGLAAAAAVFGVGISVDAFLGRRRHT